MPRQDTERGKMGRSPSPTSKPFFGYYACGANFSCCGRWWRSRRYAFSTRGITMDHDTRTNGDDNNNRNGNDGNDNDDDNNNRMMTYRYKRRELARHDPVDSCDATAGSQDSAILEYWTNGTTTHLALHHHQQQQQPEYKEPIRCQYSPRRSDASHQSQYLASSPSSSSSSSSSSTTAGTGSGIGATTSDTEPLKQQQQQQLSRTHHVARRSVLAGSISGMASTLALYPMDVLRTKLQASTGGGGPISVLRQTLQFGGVRALYTGITLPFCAQALYKGTVFTVHNVSQEWVRDYKTTERHKSGTARHRGMASLDYTDTAICGFVAGAVNAGLFVTPVELVRNQLIAQDSRLAAGQLLGRHSRGSWDLVLYTVRRHGPSRLWRGTGISMWRDGIGVAAFFCAKRFVESTLHADGSKPTFGTTVLAGGLAGLSFWIVSLPLDTIKTWIQSGDLSQPPVRVAAQLQRLYAQRGFVGTVQQLLRGWQVAYSRGIPSAALTIAVYSTAFHALGED